MADGQAKLQKAVTEMIEGITKDMLNPLQKKSYLCMAACFDRKGTNAQQTQNCVQNCGAAINQAQNIINHEINDFQNRLERCSMACQDEVKDLMRGAGSQDDAALQNKAQEAMQKCFSRNCVDKHVKLLPAIDKSLREGLKNLK